ncbi:MAG TPA: hypothetical protein DE061_02635 [Clostridiales bacterium]|nr:hypothetical protein [Clostridiales bacterium]
MTTLKKIVPIFAIVMCLVLCVALVACGDNTPDPSTTIQYTVTFVYGTGAENATVKVDSNATVTKPDDPEREGYEFVGWKEEGASEDFDFNTKITKDTTLVAQWNEEVAQTARIRWTDDEAVTFVFTGATPKNVEIGTVIEFGVRVSPYYVGEFKVYAGTQECVLGENGKYSFTAEKSVTVSVDGLRRDDAKIKGYGTEKSPYLISNAAQLKTFTDSINAGEETYAESYVALTADIDFKGETIEPIGGQQTYFMGTFDGRGHVVSNFNFEASDGVAGFFGYIATATVKNLTIDANVEIEALDKQHNYILGGIVAYNIGGDIVNCNFKGSYTVTSTLPSDNIVYLGGIVGFMQGYGTEYMATASFCTVQADLVSNGQSSLYAIGGIAAAAYGPNSASVAYVNNCSFIGNIEGRNKYAGGVVGYLRTSASVANCYVDGMIEAKSGSDASYAGGLVGASDNETAISSSVAIGVLSSSKQQGEDELSDISGLIFRDAYNEIDTKKAVLFKSYYTQAGTITDGKTYRAESLSDLCDLLGWVPSDWKEDNGAILPVYSDTAEGSISAKFVFGRNVTKEDNNGNPLTQTEDTVTITGVMPIYYIYGGSGMNNFVADKESADDTKNMVSYGYFFDAEHTQRIPSSFLITADLTVYVGFADYTAVKGDYYAVLQTLKNNEIYNAELHLVFDDNGKMTMYYDGIVADYMYVYNGEKLLVKDAYFAYLVYTSSNGYSLLADYYADIEGNVLNIYDNLFFTNEKDNVIVARKQNAAMGTWYTSAGTTYTFLSDLTGERTNANGTETFTYTCNEHIVTLTIGTTRVIASISEDGLTMQSTSAGLQLEKRDIFAGKWESDFNRIETITFDGKGSVEYKGTTYEYVLDGEKASFGSIVATFDENGLLVVKDGGVSTTYGRDGSFIGTWTDTLLNYTIILNGIGKNGYGTGKDSSGIEFNYVAEYDETGTLMVNMYYQTRLYGMFNLATNNGMELLYLAGYYASTGMLVDDYNMAYYDPYYGTWNGTNGVTYTFNGFGSYDIDYNTSQQGRWYVKGLVTVEKDGSTSEVAYYYNKKTGEATFTIGNVTYTAKLDGNGITVNEVIFKAPDYVSQYEYHVGDDVLRFNGKSPVGLGKATLTTADGVETYDYATADVENKYVVTLTKDGAVVYIIRFVDGSATIEKDGVRIEDFGLYHKIVGKEYLLSGDKTFKITTKMDINGIAKGTFGGIDVDVFYVDENYVSIYTDGLFLYYIGYLDENNVVVLDSSKQTVSVLTIADEYAGTYTAADGSTIVFDGRSKGSDYVYAYATLTIFENVDGDIEETEYRYVYKVENGEICIYDIDRSGESGEDEVLIIKYKISFTEVAGAKAFTNSDGTTIYLVEAGE